MFVFRVEERPHSEARKIRHGKDSKRIVDGERTSKVRHRKVVGEIIFIGPLTT